MGKIKTFQPEDKFKNFSRSTTKPFKSNAPVYQQKVWTPEEQIYSKLEIITEFLEHLFSKLSEAHGKNVKLSIQKNLEILNKDLSLMKNSLLTVPSTFNPSKLKINQNCITEMKSAFDTLQAFEVSHEESKKLSKMKHVLTELEHLIHPNIFESNLEKEHAKQKLKKEKAKKRPLQGTSRSKKVKKSIVKPKVKKSKSTSKVLKKRKLTGKKLKKTSKLVKKPKPSAKKTIKPKKTTK